MLYIYIIKQTKNKNMKTLNFKTVAIVVIAAIAIAVAAYFLVNSIPVAYRTA